MKAVVYTEIGDPDVLHVVDRPMPEPGPGEVRVAVHSSGVNPTDWKSRRGHLDFPEQVPGMDGAGVIDEVGPDVDPSRLGQGVWVWEAAWHSPGGTAQEYVVLPSAQAIDLPLGASFELGASLGIPALTAHRCLTVRDGGPARLHPGSLDGRTVLVAGGAGAVGNAAIQLATWAGAVVISTVSSPAKAELARAAGAHRVVNYRDEPAAKTIREIAPDGVDIIVEVAPHANSDLDGHVLAAGGVVAMYNRARDADPIIPLNHVFGLNARWQGVLVYTMPGPAKQNAVIDVSAAVAAGAIRIGPEGGLPLHRFGLDQAADAHAAVERNTVGKVLITVR
jgi:NADPH2:quinone reductase